MKRGLLLIGLLFFIFAAPLRAQEEPLPTEPVPEMLYGSIHGGGQIVDLHSDLSKKKRMDVRKISFGGYTENNNGELGGFWQVIFHNVGNAKFNKARFHATEIVDITFEQGEGCLGAKFTAMGSLSYLHKGKLIREDGWQLIFKATDSGPPKRGRSSDTVWIGLLGPETATDGEPVYDYSTLEDFTSEENCLTWEGTLLDKGNLTVLIMTEETAN